MLNFGKFELTPLFAVPVTRVQLDPISQDIKDFLMQSPEIIDRPTFSEAMGGSYKPLSHDLNILDNPICQPLKEAIMNNARDYLYNVLGCTRDLDFRMSGSWVSKQKPGTNLGMHNHANSQLSGACYLQTTPEAGRIVFHRRKHFDNVFTEALNVPIDYPNPLMAGGWPFDVHENEVILFPSNLEHSVEFNNSDQDRYCVAFNIIGYGIYGYEGVTQIEIK